MSEQGFSEENTPAVAGPEGTPGTAEQTAQAEVNWQEKYANLQPEYTRTTQRVAELERQQELFDLLVSTDDPDTRRQVAERLGYVLDEEEQTQDADTDPFAAVDERLARVEQQLTARQQQEADATRATEVRQHVDEQLEALGIDKDDQDWVLAYAINALPPTPDGLPDIEQANQVFSVRETERQRNWAKTKRAPFVPPGGRDATEVPDPGTGQQARLNRALLSLRNSMGDNE